MTFTINMEGFSDPNSGTLRTAIAAEIAALNLYEDMARMEVNTDIRKLLFHIADEKKTHIGEFAALLLNFDEQQAEELMAGQEEVEEMGIEVLHPILIK